MTKRVAHPEPNAREAILAAARLTAQAHGYGGLNFRDLAAQVGIKSASIYYHFPSKADLASSVAQRYWEDARLGLDAMRAETPDPLACLRRYPGAFRTALETDNRVCLVSFMAAEYDDLPDPVKAQVKAFADVNIAWLSQVLAAGKPAKPQDCEPRARAIYAAVAGAQLVARGRSDITLYDVIIESFRAVGLFDLLPVS